MRLTTVLKSVGIFAAVFAALSVGVMYAFFSSLPDLCGNEVISEVLSPDGTRKAVVFSRDCGATTDVSTQVAVLKLGESLGSNPESVLAADTNRGTAARGAWGGPEVIAHWNSASELVVRVATGARILRSGSSPSAITIKHELAEERNGG